MSPSPVLVDDDAPLRRDTDSDDVRRVYPDLPTSGDTLARNRYAARRDWDAYVSIRDRFPAFTPPLPPPTKE